MRQQQAALHEHAATDCAVAERRPPAAHRGLSLAVWGHFHGGNLGDELVVGVLIDAIRWHLPHARVIAVSLAPADTEWRHGVSALPLNPTSTKAVAPAAAARHAASRGRPTAVVRSVPGVRRARRVFATVVSAARELRFLIRAYRSLDSIDRIVVAGSGQLLDAWRGPWEHPWATFRWALLARITGTEMVFPSVGAGPIDGRLSRLLIRLSLGWAAFISVRDEHSAHVLRSAGVTRELPFCPDMGWAHRLAEPVLESGPRDTPRVGVNVFAHEDPRYWPRGDGRRYAAYLEKMADLVARLLEGGNRVLLFSSQTRSDRLVAEDLRGLLARHDLDRHPRLEWGIEEIKSVADLVQAVRRCDYVVAGRFHSVLLPLSLGIPTLGLAYHPKTRDLLAQVGRPEWCFDADRFEVAELTGACRRLQALDSSEERRLLHERAASLSTLVEAQFEALLHRGPLSAPSDTLPARPPRAKSRASEVA